ncbi:MAG: single-stranded-DNA-specific exonuclease RecJ [Alphaproteobacteria bacterium]|nr:single-stranded-DNA-specific exonuclease RecJ [Alphaproteobacteria bacterium]
MAGDALTVDHSFSGRAWRPRLEDGRAALALSQTLNLPEVVGRALAARGIGPEDADRFLNPLLKDELPDPGHLKDMETAARRIADAIEGGEGIAVFGDYDVDGATSTAVLTRFFRALGIGIACYIPDRIREGYGPNPKAMLALGAGGAKVVITVDCGIAAFEALAAAKAAGIDVVVVDHHVAETRLPEALAVINPNRLDEDSPHKQLAAVGVAFLLVVAVNRELRARGVYSSRPEPDLMGLLDLVALGTVCDQVRLTGVNRALVSQGLKVLAARNNTGLVALADVAGLDSRPEAWHLGFLLGPRINAGGRVGRADLGARLLSCDDRAEAEAMARELDAFNAERREIEAAVLEKALAQAETEGDNGGPGLVFVAGDGWHPGVLGIVASRINDRLHRPTCVAGIEGGIVKGSGRSIPGIDLGAAVIAARQAGLLIAGGGHAMAAGFTVATDKLTAFKEFLAARIDAQHAEQGAEVGRILYHDGVITVGGATPDLAEEIKALAPFGQGNAEPRFVLPAVRVGKADVVGENHVRLFVNGPDGGRIKAIAFRAADQPLGAALLNAGGLPVHLAGKLRIDDWQGRHDVQFLLDDAAPAA